MVAATGYDTPALLAPLGYALPIEKEPRYLFLSEPIRERLLEPLVVTTERAFAAKQLANGRVLASDLAADPADGGGPRRLAARDPREHRDSSPACSTCPSRSSSRGSTTRPPTISP